MKGAQLLAALAADNLELILKGSSFPPGTNGPAPFLQPTLNAGPPRGEGGRENARTLELGPPALRLFTNKLPALDRQHLVARGGDHKQPASVRRKQPVTDQPAFSAPQAPLPPAQQGSSTNGKKTKAIKNKASKRYWPKLKKEIFKWGE
jgi:hypothetical protein